MRWFLLGLYLYILAVTPLLCFGLTAAGPLDPPTWQSGRLQDYSRLLLTGRTAWPFAPLLLYSIGAGLLYLLAPQRFGGIPFLRLGLYGGVLLAFQFCWLHSSVLHDGGNSTPLSAVWITLQLFLLAAVSAFLLLVLAGFAYGLLLALLEGGATIGWGCVLLLLLLPVAGVGLASPAAASAPLAFAVFATLFFGPYWTLLLLAWLALHAWRSHGSRQLRLAGLIGAVTWFGAWLAAWRVSLLQMLELYGRLPVHPPEDCYVATAAARGHPRLVGSWPVPCLGGSRRVNRQLQRLKLGEFALAAALPGFHRVLRRVYNAVGPGLARCAGRAWGADLAWLLLKPPEWLAWLSLRLLLRFNPDHLARRLYSPRPARRPLESHDRRGREA